MSSTNASTDYEYEAELIWCIKLLEKELVCEISKVRERTANNNAEKKIKSIESAIKILSNPKLAKIKKRATMKTMCPDYREKMKLEINRKSTKNELSHQLLAPQGKAIRISKSNILQKGNNESEDFKFIF